MNDNTNINEGRRHPEESVETVMGADLSPAPAPKPLKEWADPNCRKGCNGTGSIGKRNGKLVMCVCAKRRLLGEVLKIERAKRDPVTLKLSDARLKQMGIKVKDG